MAERKYDIFISYRRVGGAQYARILQLMLMQRGYKVFLDYDELKDGVFGKRIKAAIAEAPVFMLVLSKDSLDRCANADDWVREEITYAQVLGKHFVPVNPDKSFDGIHADVPGIIKTVALDNQHSEVDFGQALGATVEVMIANRLVPTLGKRQAMSQIDEDGETARETLRRIDARNRFIKRLSICSARSSGAAVAWGAQPQPAGRLLPPPPATGPSSMPSAHASPTSAAMNIATPPPASAMARWPFCSIAPSPASAPSPSAPSSRPSWPTAPSPCGAIRTPICSSTSPAPRDALVAAPSSLHALIY